MRIAAVQDHFANILVDGDNILRDASRFMDAQYRTLNERKVLRDKCPAAMTRDVWRVGLDRDGNSFIFIDYEEVI